jgi:malate dehydrogenase
MREDLLDAYGEHAPCIDVACEIHEVVADIIIVAAGDPASPQKPDRDWLALKNIALFREVAAHLHQHGHGREIVIAVSNPVELATLVIGKGLGSYGRVLGMGSFLDSHRFRKEIASELKCSTADVRAYMLGEHGAQCVPVWSSLTVRGLTESETRGRLQPLIMTSDEFANERQRAAKQVQQMLANKEVSNAIDFLKSFGPAVRATLWPVVCQSTGAKTAVGTADKVCRLVRAVVEDRRELLPVQVCLAKNLSFGFDTCIGAPVVVGINGAESLGSIADFSKDDREALAKSGELVGQKLQDWMK